MSSLYYAPFIITVGIAIYLLFILSRSVKRNFKSKKLIEDTPTSKVGSAAIGSNVEFRGLPTTHDSKSLIAPITNKQCAAYVWRLMRHDPVHQKEYICLYFYSDKYLFIKNNNNKLAAMDLSLIDKNELVFSKKQKYWRPEDIPKRPLRLLCKYPDLFNELNFEENIFLQYYSLEEAIISNTKKVYILGNTSFPENICDKKEWRNDKIVGNESNFSISSSLLEKLNVIITPRDNENHLYFSQQNEESLVYQYKIKVALFIILTVLILIALYLYVNTDSVMIKTLYGIIVVFLGFGHVLSLIKKPKKHYIFNLRKK